MPRPETIPERFWERLGALLPGDRVQGVRESFHAPKRTGVRVNTLRADRSEVLLSFERDGVDASPLDWYADGFTVPPDGRETLMASSAVRSQQVWVQNPSSMVPPIALGPRAGERVLDLAAAPGSKTLQLACLMEGEGELAAVEVVRDRFFRLKRNLKAQEAGFVRTFLQDGTRVWRYRPDHFDRVLLDAPCSTEGRFRADEPETFAYWSESKIRSMAGRQRRLLDSAVRCVRPGGVVVYATCSFAPEENEAVVSDALARHDLAVEALPITLPGTEPGRSDWEGQSFDPRLRDAVRLVPDDTYEAFFVCRLRRLS